MVWLANAKETPEGEKETEDLQHADYMITKILMTKEEADKQYPLREINF